MRLVFLLVLSFGISALGLISKDEMGRDADSGTDAKVRDVVVAVNDAFIPGGFDSLADSYVVVSGTFPNGCYKWKGATVTHVKANLHQIQSVASVSQGMCIMVLVPFSKDVHLGRLASGKHTLRFLSSDGTYLEKSMTIK
jgi:hypothetical protein